MTLAVGDRRPRVGQTVWSIHCLQQIVFELAGTQCVRHEGGLRVDELKFVSGALNPWRTRFGAHTNPVYPLRGFDRAIGFYRDFKPFGVQGLDQGRIDLEKGLATGQHHVLMCMADRPERSDLGRQGLGILKLAPEGTVRTDKVRVTKLANGAGAVFFASGPEVAAGETTKDRRATGSQSFALQRIKNFFDAIGH